MTITISRRLAHRLRAVTRRTLGLTRGPGPAVRFRRGPSGLSVEVHSIDAAVAHHDGPAGAVGDAVESLWLPLELLDDCQGKKDFKET